MSDGIEQTIQASPTTPERGVPSPTGSAIDLQVPFGQVLVARGLVERAEVDATVGLQRQLAQRGVFLRLGELLVARGLIDEDTVAEVLALQGTTILVCSECFAQYNVVGYDGGKRYRCSNCQRTLERPEQLEQLAVLDTLVAPDWELIGQGQEHEFGDYVILGQISRGGMGIIYKARQKSLERIVAMKVLTGERVTPEDRRAFRAEARAVAGLRHPYIVPVHQVGNVGEVDYFTMDYIEGLQLQRAVTSDGLSQREVVEVFLKVCEAVDYAHGEGILHCDLKPQNILVDRKRNPVLIDFGIANAVGEPDGPETSTLAGSPAYMPPEVITGEGAYSARGEVYALGATLYTALAGRPPHSGMDTVRILRSATVERVVPIRSIRRTIDRDLASVVMTALARRPDDRYATVRDFMSDLRRWLEGDEVAGASRLGRTWTRVRGRVAATVGLVVAFLLLLFTALSTVERRQQEQLHRSQVEQFDREVRALKTELVQGKLDLARAWLAAGRTTEAENLLSGALRLEAFRPHAGRLHALRAEVRQARGDGEGAEADRTAAERLGHHPR